MDDLLKKIHDNALNPRAKVILVIESILKGGSLSTLLDTLLDAVDVANRGFVHELLLGGLRQWWALSRIGESLVDKPIKDSEILTAINLGLYQLLYMQTPDYAAIGDTVAAMKQINPRAAGLVNAILRKVQKNPEKFAKKVQKNHSLPNWLAKQIKQDWGEVYDELSAGLRHAAPIFLRVNERFCSVAAYQELLTQAGIASQIVRLGFGDAQAIKLLESVKIAQLPNFDLGWVMVQDLHAQLSAHILASVEAGLMRVLDICAAPGGKTTHLLEKFHVKQLTALDSDAKRLAKVSENIQRLQLNNENVELIVADARTWQAEEKYDVILLDAPCTATGVIRRHPDITLLRQESDVWQTAELQAQILNNAWQQLKEGGYLLYATCSLLKAENAAQVSAFLDKNSDAKAVKISLDLPNQFQQAVGVQCLPLTKDGGDGFYYALLQKCVEKS